MTQTQKVLPKVRWSDDEWLTFAIELDRISPDSHFTTSESFQLSKDLLLQAMNCLPVNRMRSVANTGDFKPTLIKLFRSLRTVAPPKIKGTTMLNSPAEAAALPITTPVAAPEPTIEEPVIVEPVVAQAEPQAEPQEKIKGTKVRWTNDEWELLARELYRVRPLDSVLRSSTLATLDKTDFINIQRVLPENRRRPVVPSLVDVRKNLLVHMRVVREEVDRTLKAQAAPAPTPVAVTEPTPVAAPRMTSTAVNPYEAVFAPMLSPIINLLANQIAQSVLSQLGDNLKDQVAELVAQMVPQAKVGISPGEMVVTQKGVNRRLRFAVVGPMTNIGNALKEAFPEVEIKIVHVDSFSIEAVQQYDKIVGMTDFLSHKVRDKMRDNLGSRFHQVSGGASSAKHLIGVLLAGIHSQQKAATPATHH